LTERTASLGIARGAPRTAAIDAPDLGLAPKRFCLAQARAGAFFRRVRADRPAGLGGHGLRTSLRRRRWGAVPADGNGRREETPSAWQAFGEDGADAAARLKAAGNIDDAA
jgi:hypothetical protein